MDPQAFLATVEADHETELSRLGSSKALYAVTAGEMDTQSVLATMANRALRVAEIFNAWSTAEPDDRAAETFTIAATSRREAATIIADLEEQSDTAADVPDPGPLFECLAGFNETIERSAGLAAWTLIADGLYGQTVGFFVGSADVSTADRFRDLREDIGEVQDASLELLAATVETDDDRSRATNAASRTIEAAYDDYVSVLETLGITVKPIC